MIVSNHDYYLHGDMALIVRRVDSEVPLRIIFDDTVPSDEGMMWIMRAAWLDRTFYFHCVDGNRDGYLHITCTDAGDGL
jgi:hypothetical protein